MKYIDPRFVILIFGYVLLSEFLRIWIAAPAAHALSAFALMLIIYWFPSRLKAELLNWAGGSVLTSLAIYAINPDFPVAFTLLLFAVFFLGYFKKYLYDIWQNYRQNQ